MINIEDLKEEDVGRRIIYEDAHATEEGCITSWNSKFVFVDYKGTGSGIATPAEKLSFVKDDIIHGFFYSMKEYVTKKKWNGIKESTIDLINKEVVLTKEIRKNILQSIRDLESGKVFNDDESAENAKNTLIDFAKMAGMTTLFVLPGGSAGVIALRKFLKSESAKKIGIKDLLTLSVADKGFPLDPMPSIPKGDHPGAFGFVRKHDVHTGVDLYCEPGTTVKAIECGEVVGIVDFTGTKCNTTWWHDTRAILIEGMSGVLVYGEVKESVGLKVGDNVECGDIIGEVITVLKKDKGKPMTMLHLELYEHKTRETLTWFLNKDKPEPMLDPTTVLERI